MVVSLQYHLDIKRQKMFKKLPFIKLKLQLLAVSHTKGKETVTPKSISYIFQITYCFTQYSSPVSQPLKGVTTY